MASEPEVSEIFAVFERMVRNRDLTLFLPFIFGLSNAAFRSEGEDSGQENESGESPQRERIILINPFTQGVVVIDVASSLEGLFRDLGSGKGGQPPASKEAIDALPSVKIEEGEEGECVICLEEWEAGGMVKEMPCKHKFHPNCVDKWLGIHGSCPVCRYDMPIDEVGKKRDEEDGEERRRRIGREAWVSFSFNGEGGSSENSNQAPSGDSRDSSSSPRDDDEAADS
ncbi:E3 ubiquitin-protein ligase MPSR1-like [Prosopis cineraria]|uniref:E3 ubiquitin-protein ligase MPSR1-like n=1 Tax=Prosopis cineraria TaxID=364024 RepID=UPI00240F0F5C|nr:E3 ubiquitin-protein ligase MPSR1-like [Prosopis cineraria]